MDNFPKKNDCLCIFFVKFVGDAAQSGILNSKNSKKCWKGAKVMNNRQIKEKLYHACTENAPHGLD
jgi:hypothetical protein